MSFNLHEITANVDIHGKMADAVSEDVQAALNKIVTMADQSANMKKDLKKTIFQIVSNLRNLFTELFGITDEKTRLIIYNETENNKGKAELAACRREVAKARTETSTIQEEPPGPGSRQVLPSHYCAPKLYSTVVAECTERKHLIAQVENKPTPRYYQEDKVESEPDRHQGRDQLTEAAQ